MEIFQKFILLYIYSYETAYNSIADMCILQFLVLYMYAFKKSKFFLDIWQKNYSNLKNYNAHFNQNKKPLKQHV